MDTTPVRLVGCWLSKTYLYVTDDTGQKYAVSRTSWAFPYLASQVDKVIKDRRPVIIESKDLWDGCRELCGIQPVGKVSAA